MQAISELLTINFTESKPLTNREKKWIVQNEIFDLIQQEEIRVLNWHRYCAFLKKYKLDFRKNGQERCIKLWKQTARLPKDKDVRPIKKLDKRTFGFFTAHLDLEALFYIKSVIQDKLNRSESPTLYILSLSSSVK